MFDDLSVLEKLKPQEHSLDGTIQPKGKGRPKKPNVKPCTIYLDKVLHQRIKQHAVREDVSISHLANRALKDYLDAKTKLKDSQASPIVIDTLQVREGL